MINTIISPYLLSKNKDEIFNKWLFDYKIAGQLQRIFDLSKIIKHHQQSQTSFFSNDLENNIDLESSDCEIEYVNIYIQTSGKDHSDKTIYILFFSNNKVCEDIYKEFDVHEMKMMISGTQNPLYHNQFLKTHKYIRYDNVILKSNFNESIIQYLHEIASRLMFYRSIPKTSICCWIENKIKIIIKVDIDLLIYLSLNEDADKRNTLVVSLDQIVSNTLFL